MQLSTTVDCHPIAINYRHQHIYYLSCVFCTFPPTIIRMLCISYLFSFARLCVGALMCNFPMRERKWLLEENVGGVCSYLWGEKYLLHNKSQTLRKIYVFRLPPPTYLWIKLVQGFHHHLLPPSLPSSLSSFLSSFTPASLLPVFFPSSLPISLPPR